MTAVEVGDDDSALEAVNEIEVVVDTIDDPRLASALQLAVAWTLPIVDDLDGALAAAASALGGFRAAERTVRRVRAAHRGDVETSLSAATTSPAINRWRSPSWGTGSATPGSRQALGTQLALLAVKAGDLGEARALLAAAVDSIEDANVSTLTVTFALVACAQIALAEGDALRAATVARVPPRRFGSVPACAAWPLSRRGEADLATSLAETSQTRPTASAGRDAGSELDHRGSLVFVRESARSDSR